MSSAAGSSLLRRGCDWLFRDREAGRIVIAQLPNPPLIIFLGASLIRRLGDPEGDVRTVVTLVAAGALLWWALDEVLRGVNPFRRILGAVVLALTVASWLQS